MHQEDDIVAFLNGETPAAGAALKSSAPDTPIDQGPTREQLLNAVPVDTRTPVEKADAVNQNGYKVEVDLRYYARDPQSAGRSGPKTEKRATFSVVLPTLNAALSVIKNHIVKPLMLKKDPAFVAPRLMRIVKVTPLGNAAPVTSIEYMGRADLEKAIAARKIPLDPSLYPQDNTGLTDLREMAMDWLLSPGNREAFAERERTRREESDAMRQLALLNPGIGE